MAEPVGITRSAPRSRSKDTPETIVYTDGACTNNSEETTCAGSRVWYGTNDPRNQSKRVPLNEQLNQMGELMAILIMVKNQPAEVDLRIMSDS